MTDRIKRATPADVPSLAELSDTVFRPTHRPGTSMGVEFAPMFSAENASNLYFVEQDGKPVSLVGMMPGRVNIHGVSVRVASMGSVCTLADYRRHHFASQMVEQVVHDFAADTSVLLVSGELSIYRRVGCVNFGDWIAATIGSHRSASSDSNFTVQRGVPDVSFLHALYRAEPLRFSRSFAQMKALTETMSAPQFRAQSRPPEGFAAYRDGVLVAYALALQPDHDPSATFFFEWAGDRTALPALTHAASQHFGTSTVGLVFDPLDAVCKSVLQAHGATFTTTKNEGTLRVLNVGLLLREMGPLVEELYGARLELVNQETDVWVVSWMRAGASSTDTEHLPGQGRVLKGPAELSQWLFDPSGLNLPFPRTDDLNFI